MPRIILDLNIDDDIKDVIEEKLKAKKLLIDEYILELIKKDVNSIFSFSGYSYYLIFDKLYYGNEEIKFTNKEMKLFKFLFNNANTLMTLEDIHSNVWGNKNMSLFTLRNKINSIRNKTYYELIKNVSNHGYMMVIEDD